MSVVGALITRLEGVSPVTALVSTRIYQGVLPQSVTLPAIRMQRIGQDEPLHLRGFSGLMQTRVQVDSVGGGGNPISAAQAVDAVVFGTGAGSSLVGWRGTVGSIWIQAVLPAAVRELFDADELRQYRVIRDLLVWWKTA